MTDRERFIELLKEILPTRGNANGIPIIQRWNYGAVGDTLINNGALLPVCKLGGYVYRMLKYNGENKVYRYKVTRISYELHGDEVNVLYSARCEELKGYPNESLMFFESVVGKTVFLAEEDVEGA